MISFRSLLLITERTTDGGSGASILGLLNCGKRRSLDRPQGIFENRMNSCFHWVWAWLRPLRLGSGQQHDSLSKLQAIQQRWICQESIQKHGLPAFDSYQ
jgi:hypothetical protein